MVDWDVELEVEEDVVASLSSRQIRLLKVCALAEEAYRRERHYGVCCNSKGKDELKVVRKLHKALTDNYFLLTYCSACETQQTLVVFFFPEARKINLTAEEFQTMHDILGLNETIQLIDDKAFA
jgi:hypothetical protein